MKRLARSPSVSFPEAMGSEAELLGAYRLVHSKAVSMEVLDEAHYEFSRAAAAAATSPLLVVHDTTQFCLRRGDPAEIGYLNTGRAGFLAHLSLLINPAANRRPIGVSNVEITRRTKPPRSRRKKSSKTSRPTKAKKRVRESEKWMRGVEASEARLQGAELIHVADREADGYEFLGRCVEKGYRFVVRVRVTDRVVH